MARVYVWKCGLGGGVSDARGVGGGVGEGGGDCFAKVGIERGGFVGGENGRRVRRRRGGQRDIEIGRLRVQRGRGRKRVRGGVAWR
eukprot:1025357-Rhodomonas_salina.1